MIDLATTTTKAHSVTTNTYNNDLSLANQYKPKDISTYQPTLLKAGQQSIDEYATNRGYDAPYKYQDLLNNVYMPGVEAKYKQDVYGTQLAQNSYGQSLNDLNRSTIDAIRSETANAVASGASRALTDANVLKSILGLQQESVADATELAQQYKQAEVDYAVNLAQALADASSDAWNRQNAIDAETLQLFDRMQTAYDNKYTADAGLASTAYNADAAAFSNLLATLANRVLSEETNATSTTVAPDVSYGGSGSSSGSGNTKPEYNGATSTNYRSKADAEKALNGLSGGSSKYKVVAVQGTNGTYYQIRPIDTGRHRTTNTGSTTSNTNSNKINTQPEIKFQYDRAGDDGAATWGDFAAKALWNLIH